MKGNLPWRSLLRLLLAAVFMLAGWTKAADAQAFADGIIGFRAIPLFLVNPLAIIFPVVEIAAAIMLLIKPLKSAAALMACGLSFVFLALFVSAAVRGIEVQCACFGKWELTRVSTGQGLLRALLLLAAAVVVYLPYFKQPPPQAFMETAGLKSE